MGTLIPQQYYWGAHLLHTNTFYHNNIERNTYNLFKCFFVSLYVYNVLRWTIICLILILSIYMLTDDTLQSKFPFKEIKYYLYLSTCSLLSMGTLILEQ